MASNTRPLTVDEFLELSEDSGSVYHELHHGQVVAVVRPKMKHSQIQTDLLELLLPLKDSGSYVSMEVPYRPLPEHELWVADVAYLSAERRRALAEGDGDFRAGAIGGDVAPRRGHSHLSAIGVNHPEFP